MLAPVALRLAIALGIGRLIGAERERRKGARTSARPSGHSDIRHHAVLGAISLQLGGEILLAVVLAAIAGLSILANLRTHQQDPGVTTDSK